MCARKPPPMLARLCVGVTLLVGFAACARTGFSVDSTRATDDDVVGDSDNGDGDGWVSRTWCDNLTWVQGRCDSANNCQIDATIDCADANACTDHTCDASTGCHEIMNTMPCIPAGTCASQGQCNQGQCLALASDKDDDNDGHVDALCPGGDDCDDKDADIHPGASESYRRDPTCWDLRDNDCNGLTDDADPVCPKTLWRSVGIAGSNLNSAGATGTIVGSTATFSSALPNNIGVGDVLQYQVGGVWYLAFVHGRNNATSLLVKNSAGNAPQGCAGGTTMAVYRAYRSLAAWQLQDENPAITLAARDFDTTKDLVTAQRSLHVACYDDGPEVGNVQVDSWITSPMYFVGISTPWRSFEVGISQRHHGTYGGYRLELDDPAYAALGISGDHFRIDGLSFRGFPGGSTTVQIWPAGTDVELFFTHNIVDSNQNGDNNGTLGINANNAATDGNVFIANNAVYATSVAWAECIWMGNYENFSPLNFFLYNNSAVNCFRGFEGRSTEGHVLAKNNVALSDSPDFFDNSTSGAFNSASTANCSADTTAGEIGTNAIVSVDPATVYVSRVSGAEDIHLANNSPCANQGVNLSNDAIFPVRDDIDGNPRPLTGAWDIGADER